MQVRWPSPPPRSATSPAALRSEPGKSTVHGVQAEPGQCVDGFCMLHAWCPVEAGA